MVKTSKKRLAIVSLIAAYSHYVELLEEENGATTSLAWIHGWRPKRGNVARGKRYRAKISRLKAAFDKITYGKCSDPHPRRTENQ